MEMYIASSTLPTYSHTTMLLFCCYPEEDVEKTVSVCCSGTFVQFLARVTIASASMTPNPK
jgi:hypothetical protein